MKKFKKVLIANAFGVLIEAYRTSAEPSVLFAWMYAAAFMLQIYFDTEPVKRERMNTIVQNELRRIADEGPRALDFEKTHDNLLKRHAEQLQENSYWLNAIDTYYYRGFDGLTDFEATVRSMTPAKIQAFAQQLLQQGNWVEVVMEP